jgi:hypothetical protein
MMTRLVQGVFALTKPCCSTSTSALRTHSGYSNKSNLNSIKLADNMIFGQMLLTMQAMQSLLVQLKRKRLASLYSLDYAVNKNKEMIDYSNLKALRWPCLRPYLEILNAFQS